MNEELDVNEILSAMRQQVGTMAQENAILLAKIKKLEALLKEKDDRE